MMAGAMLAREVPMEQLINRAMNLMSMFDEIEAARILLADGVDGGDVFLAVRAARILLTDAVEA